MRIKTKYFWLWHEPSNSIAFAKVQGGLPLLTILDGDEVFNGINPFLSYPLRFLDYYGWHILGEDKSLF